MLYVRNQISFPDLTTCLHVVLETSMQSSLYYGVPQELGKCGFEKAASTSQMRLFYSCPLETNELPEHARSCFQAVPKGVSQSFSHTQVVHDNCCHQVAMKLLAATLWHFLNLIFRRLYTRHNQTAAHPSTIARYNTFLSSCKIPRSVIKRGRLCTRCFDMVRSSRGSEVQYDEGQEKL